MNQIKIIMGFDFGIKNIGVAVGQQLTYTAQPITTLKAKTGIPDWNKIKKIFDEWKPYIFIVGLPINTIKKNKQLTKLIYQFSTQLHKTSKIQVIMHDERFSTTEARANLFEHYGYRALTPNQINATSAVIILESWLQQTKRIKIY